MKFLLDQDVYHKTYKLLMNKGYDAITAKSLGLEKAPDIQILEKAGKLSRILITRDKKIAMHFVTIEKDKYRIRNIPR